MYEVAGNKKLLLYVLQIPTQFLIRMQYNDYVGTNMFYMCRTTETGGLSIIKWCYFESLPLLDLIEKFLASWDRHKALGGSAHQLIDFFDGKDEQRAYEHEGKDWKAYFENADLATESLRVRFGKRRGTNSYTMLLHQPVEPKEPKTYVWHGPRFYLSLTGLRNLVHYLRVKHRECMQPTEPMDM